MGKYNDLEQIEFQRNLYFLRVFHLNLFKTCEYINYIL